MKFRNLYIHVPFCRSKCAYCAFYSLENASPKKMEEWLDQLSRHLESALPDCEAFRSIYIGGGTPTLLPVPLLKRLFGRIRSLADILPDAEISMECNPGTLTEAKAEAAAGFVNRVSMGVQSFRPENLRRIGRRSGDLRSVSPAFSLWRSVGIRNIGIDLIYAIPGQTLEEWTDDLEQAAALKPDHLSAYSLSLEEGSRLDSLFRENENPEKFPDDAAAADMWEAAGDILLSKAGLPRYEISNYASSSRECRHNQNVWHGDTLLGLGPAAASFDGTLRFTQIPSLSAWLSGAPPENDPLPKEKRAREIFVMGLRTVRGWRAEEFCDASGGIAWDCFARDIERCADDDLLELSSDTVRPTHKGLLFWNTLAGELI